MQSKSFLKAAAQSRRHWNIALFIASLLLCIVYYATTYSCRLDDSFIYLRIVDNFFRFHKPIYNAGDERFISTSPLWLIFLTMGKAALNAEVAAVSKWLYILFLAQASIVFRALALKKFPLAAALSPFAVFCPLIAVAMVGMETAMCLAIGLTLLWAYREEKWILFGILSGLFYLARAEGALLVAILFSAFAVREWKQSPQPSLFIRKLWKPVLACAIVVSIWHAYYFFAFHHLFPDTLHAKIEQGLSGRWTLFHKTILKNLYGTARQNTCFMTLLLLGAIRLSVQLRWLMVWALIHAVAYSLLRVPDYYWYFYPILFIGSFSIFAGADYVIQWTRHRSARVAAIAAAVLLPSLLVWTELPKARFVPSGDPRRTAYRQVADWIRRHESGPKTIVMDEIGIVGYYLGDHLIFDTVGLSNPNVTHATMCRFDPAVRDFEPSFLVFRLAKGKPLPAAELSYKIGRGHAKYRRDFVTDTKAAFSAAVYRRLGTRPILPRLAGAGLN